MTVFGYSASPSGVDFTVKQIDVFDPTETLAAKFAVMH
jgi:hypothetical protein